MAKTIDLTGGFDYTSDEADGASAVAFDFNTATAFSTSGAKLASFKNNSVEKTYMDKDGCIVGPAGSASNVTFSVGADVDTGMYGSVGTIRFSAAGTQRSAINAQGVIIYDGFHSIVGTTSPAGGTNSLCLGITTSAATQTAGKISLQCRDSSDGATNATLAITTEQSVETIGTFTPSHKHKIWINGVEYWIQLDAV